MILLVLLSNTLTFSFFSFLFFLLLNAQPTLPSGCIFVAWFETEPRGFIINQRLNPLRTARGRAREEASETVDAELRAGHGKGPGGKLNKDREHGRRQSEEHRDRQQGTTGELLVHMRHGHTRTRAHRGEVQVRDMHRTTALCRHDVATSEAINRVRCRGDAMYA